MKKLRTWLAAMMMVATLGGASTSVLTPTPSLAACNDTKLLTMPAWYRGVANEDATCSIKNPNDVGGISPFIWKIVLNIIDIMLNLAAYLAVGYIIYGGFKYMLATGSADGITKAKTTIANSVIGLVIAIVAIAIVNVVARLF